LFEPTHPSGAFDGPADPSTGPLRQPIRRPMTNPPPPNTHPDLDAQRTLWIKRARVGGIMLVGGAVVTLIGYAAAASQPGGGQYLLFWGPMVFGAYRLIDSFVRIQRINKQAAMRPEPAPSVEPPASQ